MEKNSYIGDFSRFLKLSFYILGYSHHRICAWVSVSHGLVPSTVGLVPGSRTTLRGPLEHGHEDWTEHGRLVLPLLTICFPYSSYRHH